MVNAEWVSLRIGQWCGQ